MCAVCFTGLQAVPVAAIAARAWWVKKRGQYPLGVDGEVDAGADTQAVTSPGPTSDDRPVATAASN